MTIPQARSVFLRVSPCVSPNIRYTGVMTVNTWEFATIHALQGLPSPAFPAFFAALSFLGEERFFLVLLPLLIWCVNARLGARAGVAFLASVCLNALLKEWWHQPRPFVLDPSIRHANVVGYGMPSGHAQSAVVVWGMLALWTRRPWVSSLCLLLILLVGLSRVGLGVHSPTQVLAGWGVGAGLLTGSLLLLPRFARLWKALPRAAKLTAAVLLPPVLVLSFPDTDVVSAMGVLSGLGIGWTLGQGRLDYGTAGTSAQIRLRLAVGLVVLFVLYAGLSALFPKEGAALYHPLRYARYALLGLWISLGAPWLFARLGWVTGPPASVRSAEPEAPGLKTD